MICSHWSTFHAEVLNITDFLVRNAYPRNFVENVVRMFLSRKFGETSPNSVKDSGPVFTFVLPYIGQQSLLLKKRLTTAFVKMGVNINCVFRSHKVGSHFSLKDKTHPLLKASLIYSFQCLDDPSCTYIGQTKRYLQQRIDQHIKEPSAISHHSSVCHICKQGPIAPNFSVLKQVQGPLDLSICEALFIKSCNPSLNKQIKHSGTSITLTIY